MPLVPARYAYIVVAIVLLTLFYTTAVPSHDSERFWHGSLTTTASAISQHIAGGNQRASQRLKESPNTRYLSSQRPNTQFESIPSFKKPDVLPSDDKSEQQWIESSVDDGQRSWNTTETQSKQEAVAMPMPADDPATKVYSAQDSSPTWSPSALAKDGWNSHKSPELGAIGDEVDTGDLQSRNVIESN